jgi:hypothetical protein
MRKSRSVAGILLALAAVALIVAGPIMVWKGFDGQSQIRGQLTAQKIVFPAKADLPADLQSYANVTVTTGPQAKAYSDMVEEHVMAATKGQTYSEVSAAWIAGGRTDATLAQLRQTAFMGESLRASLLSAYQAWELTWLVIGIGALLTGMSVVLGVSAFAMRPIKITVPASPEVIKHQERAHR